MSQANSGMHHSYKAGETIPAYRVVHLSAAHQVCLCDTSTALIVGVSQDQVDTSGFVPVATIYGDSSKVQCFSSIAAGDTVAPATDAAGRISTVTPLPVSTDGVFHPTLGVALQAGSTDSVIEVLLQPNNASMI
jgi:hypothetical protein